MYCWITSVITVVVLVCPPAGNRDTSEYEIECEYDFSILVLMHWIVTFHTNLLPIAFFLTGQQKEGVRALGK